MSASLSAPLSAPLSALPVASSLDFDLGNDVHVWVLPPVARTSGVEASPYAAWHSLLSPDEQERAHRFHFARHRDSFISNRARLRILLGRHLDVHPGAVRFDYASHGKPELAGRIPLFFNLSHTNGLALIAVSALGPVGIDVEHLDRATDSLELAQRFFSPSEVAVLETMTDPEEQRRAFLRCWTRKEAFLKALGDGLTRPLADFSVSLDAANARLLHCAWDPAAADTWTLRSLEPCPGFTGALAYQQRPETTHDPVHIHTWFHEPHIHESGPTSRKA